MADGVGAVDNSSEVSLNQFPKLLVPGIVENSNTRRLLQQNPETGYFEQKGHELHVPHEHICRGSAYGWLFLTDDNLDMKLLNPFSGAEIQLPPVSKLPLLEETEQWALSKWFVHKAVWSANPSIEPRPIVFVIHGGQHVPRLAFCKPGDEAWTPLKFPVEWGCHMDAIYYKDKFYVLSYPGNVAAFDIRCCAGDEDYSVETTLVATARKGRVYTRDWHLLVLDGELVRFSLRKACFDDCCSDETNMRMEEEILRDGDTTDEDYTDEDTETDFDYKDEDENENEDEDEEDGHNENPSHHFYITYGFKIRRFDESEKQWVKVENLGDKAVFLGYNTSFALTASDYPTGVCIPNSIYFTYGSGGNMTTEIYCYDRGIYNLKDKSMNRPLNPPTDDSHQLRIPAAIWIVNAVEL